MESIFPVLLILIFTVVVIFAVYSNFKRVKEWEQFAHRHGLVYQKWDSIGLPSHYADYSLFKNGHSKKAYNLCRGKKEEKEICTFDYKYVTGSGKNRQTHHETGLLVSTSFPWKPLSIRPENVFDKISAAVGFDDIDFESAEFSKRFYVKGEDKKFAYDIIHSRTMEFLLQSKPMYIEARNRTVLFHRNYQIPVSDMEILFMEANKFFDLIPVYVKKNVV